jgi:chromosome segregation ATPase
MRDKAHEAELAILADELAGIRAEIKALRSERDHTADVRKLEDDIEKLRREKARLTEDNDRKIRDTEHKVGLLKTRQDHDVEHATRMAKLEVRESNLKADQDRFAGEMKFQREHLQGEVDRIDGLLRAILDRLPSIEVELTGGAGTRRTPRKDPE